MLAQNQKIRQNNKSIVFVDTSAIAAVVNGNDKHHNSALRIYKKLQRPQFYLLVTNFVIAETHALLLKKGNINIAREWLMRSAYKDFSVHRPEEDMEMEAVKRIDKYKDKDFSLTDMLSFLVMEKIGIKYYFAYDRHFAQIGLFNNIAAYQELSS